MHTDCLISDTSTVPGYHLAILECIDGTVVFEAALGAAEVDVYGWQRFCSAFGSISGELAMLFNYYFCLKIVCIFC